LAEYKFSNLRLPRSSYLMPTADSISLFPVKRRFVISSRRRLEIQTLCFGTLAVWLAFSWAFLVQRLVRYHSAFPAWDYWRVVLDLAHLRADGLAVLLRPHNEHRIIFPETIEMLDALFGGRTILPVICSFAFYVLTYVWMAWAFLRDRTPRTAIRAFGAIFAGLILGWPGAAVVVGDPFLLQWTLSTFCAVLAIFSLSTGQLITCLLAAVIATYSSSNCLLIWPVLFWEAWLLALRRRSFLAIAAVGIMSIGTYFVGYHPDNNVHTSVILAHPLQALGFLTTFMGMPFGLGKSNAFGVTVGAANIGGATLLFAIAYRRRWLQSRTLICLFSLYLLILLTAVLVMQGRFTLDAGYGDAKGSRFWVIQLVSWTVLALLCLWCTAKWNFNILAPVTAAVLLFLFGVSELKLRSSLTYDDDQSANRQLASLSFETGLNDPGLARRIFPSPSFVSSLLPYLQHQHLSVYSLQEASWLGKPANDIGQVISDVRAGAVTYSFPVIGGVELVGWTDPDRRGAEEIVLLNQQRRIAGLGRKLPAGFPLDLRNPATPEREAWVAFVNTNYASEYIMPYFLRRGRLQPIGTMPLTLNDALQSVPGDPGILISGLRWQRDPAWVENGTFALRDPGNVPRGTIYGTSSREDTKTGQITSAPFETPNGCLVLPVSHGPNVEGLSMQVIDADDGQTLQSIPLQNGDWGWRYWQIKLTSATRRIRIVGKEEGHAWGEWLALATPSQCAAADR
jgi:hypothetical protein